MDKPFEVGDWVMFREVNFADVCIYQPMSLEEVRSIDVNYVMGGNRIDRIDSIDPKNVNNSRYMVTGYVIRDKTLYTFGGQLHGNLELEKDMTIESKIRNEVKDFLKENSDE